MSLNYQQALDLMGSAQLVFKPEEVQAAVDRIAQIITADYEKKKPLMVCLMNGGLYFMGMLLQRMPFPLEQDYFQVSRYRGEKTGTDNLEWRVIPQSDLKGRDVILVDDILDEGPTLHAVINFVKERGANSVKTAVLVDKQHNRREPKGFKADYTGLVCDDLFLVGCGMDYKELFRNLPGIYALQGGV